MKIFKSVVVIATILVATTTQICFGQVSDGDEQFQVIHQDIGRISGGASNSPVAPQTTIVKQHQQPDLEPIAFEPPQQQQQQQQQQHHHHQNHQHQHQHNNGNSRRQSQQQQQQHQQQQHVTRKPRITLAVRTSAPVLVSLVEPQQPQLQQQHHARAEQSFIASQLAAPPQQQQQQHQHQHQHQNFQPTFQPINNLPAAPAPAVEAIEPALPLAEAQNQQAASQGASSFRSSLGHTNSVSARHSALIAQVAAERAAATANSNSFPVATDFPLTQNQPSLGSPIEALSVPSIAQVQAPQQQTALASQPISFTNQAEEPIVAPSFEHVLGHGCPRLGVFSYENKDFCDRYYMCTNGTFTEEACPNGLAYSQMGAVYQHCAYNWNVDCGRKKTSEPLASPGCPWQFGIFPIQQAGRCSIDYFVCEWGVPETKRCSPEGLFYDDRIKGCQWADQLGCKSEALLNFKCPSEDEDNPYWPYPRYYHTKQDIIVCVNEQPRLVHCNEEQIVDPSSLACLDLKKKKKKF